jgi:hypothetical protein
LARPRTSLENKIVHGTGEKPADMSDDRCANWRFCQSKSLTPVMRYEGRTRPVRRVLWEELRGHLRRQQRLESTCGNILCVNPYHARPALVAGADRD